MISGLAGISGTVSGDLFAGLANLADVAVSNSVSAAGLGTDDALSGKTPDLLA